MSPQSRSQSRAHRSPSPGPYVPQPESLILPDGAVGDEAAELLEDLVHPNHEDLDADADYRLRKESHKHLPWWKTPSPWWLLVIVPFTAIAMSATIAPRIEIYTLLACSVHKPDILRQTLPTLGGSFDIPGISPIMPPMLPENGKYSQDFSVPRLGVQNDTEVPKRPGGICASDPVVQAAVAKLTAVITASMGILSCLTTGWWGSFSDRHGRTRLLGLSVIGLLLTDFNFIFVSRNFQRLPGGYWFLLLGPLIEGSLGGLTASVAAMHAYIADTTTEATRSRTFSLSLGLLFTGMAIGPTFGGLLIRFSGQLLSVFYAAAAVHLIYAFLIWFVLPESLLKSQMQQSKIKYDEEVRDTALDRERNPAVGLLVRAKRLFAFLLPLTVFLPELKPRGPGDNPLKRKKRDWNLTIVAAVYGLAVSIMGSYTFKFQFAASTFGWTSETPKPVTIEVPSKSNNPAEGPLLSSTTSASSEPNSTPKTVTKELHSPAFDLRLAHASLFIEVISYTFLAIAPTALFFTVFSMLASMGAGLNPALQSVALAMYRRRGGTESGRLFGALSVIQALSSQILGPALYGLVYMKTVATFPRGIFILSMVTIMTSFALLTFVRLPKETRSGPSSGSESDPLLSLSSSDVEDEETRIGSDREETLLGDGLDNPGRGAGPPRSSERH
ncbi:hypothetical protein D9615_009966 [Tricholomella constricta]|uniref:MFS general substrate transporter n=1 Tax=Tricholomella constricta TaxID=117010 RepID=A0A8H5LTV2_9AGAR|nr:hypothetical protein D9615_009966 [Tricholomella constricta]